MNMIDYDDQPHSSAISPLRMLAVKQQKPEVQKLCDLNDDDADDNHGNSNQNMI